VRKLCVSVVVGGDGRWCAVRRVLLRGAAFSSRAFSVGFCFLPNLCRVLSQLRAFLLFGPEPGFIPNEVPDSRAGHRETVVISIFLCSSIGLWCKNAISACLTPFSWATGTSPTCRPWCKSKKKRTITPPYRPWRKSSSTMKPVCSSETQIRIL
jgi:hypothetical protein